MTDTSASDFAAPPASRYRLILIVYTVAIFTSALLLFSVQPMFTKLVLPRLGGSPAVWSVAMVFFQTLLLAGYVYAHFLSKLRNRTSRWWRSMSSCCCWRWRRCRSRSPSAWAIRRTRRKALWLLGLFTISIGLPFFALAANNPLLQVVVRAHRPSRRPRSVFSLRVLQYRQLPRAVESIRCCWSRCSRCARRT